MDALVRQQQQDCKTLHTCKTTSTRLQSRTPPQPPAAATTTTTVMHTHRHTCFDDDDEASQVCCWTQCGAGECACVSGIRARFASMQSTRSTMLMMNGSERVGIPDSKCQVPGLKSRASKSDGRVPSSSSLSSSLGARSRVARRVREWRGDQDAAVESREIPSESAKGISSALSARGCCVRACASDGLAPAATRAVSLHPHAQLNRTRDCDRVT